jgi:hypothetical protein
MTRTGNIMIISVMERRSEIAPPSRPRCDEGPDPGAVPRWVDPVRRRRRRRRRARRGRGSGRVRQLEELGRREPRRGVVGRHRLGHPDRRVRRPDAGRSSVSDAASSMPRTGLRARCPSGPSSPTMLAGTEASMTIKRGSARRRGRLGPAAFDPAAVAAVDAVEYGASGRLSGCHDRAGRVVRSA